MAGRVGDSSILGAGLYVDNDVGSCGAIGDGEASMQNVCSYAVVELMRSGLSPADAGLSVLQRVADKTAAGQCDEQGRPKFNLQLFALARDGSYAGAAMWGPKQIAVSDERGTRLEECVAVFER
jgi:N4-(beta-N-acetylglucosaminyl)-L-asparaginase